MDATKPFLKWAGGKTQLIPAIASAFPSRAFSDNKLTYVEPFVGGGAVLFWFLKNYPQTQNVIINDSNSNLTQAYKVIKENPKTLIDQLKSLEYQYKALSSHDAQKDYYLKIRETFNLQTQDAITQTSQLIFLNRTCFNGLYRVNRNNHFNVPFGRYKNPQICNAQNILAASYLLKNVVVLQGDYENTLDYAPGKAFFYLDPPYRPLSKTSGFNAYASNGFDDREQNRLAQFCTLLHRKGNLWLLSNSDPKNTDSSDNFFDDLYRDFYIQRIPATRRINSDAAKRGEINELLISNYNP